MEPYALQQAITEDLKQLKHLKISIIPAKIYYRALLRLSFGVFWKIGLVFLLATAYVYLTYTNPHAVMNSMYSGAVRGATFYGAQIKDVLLITSGIMVVVTLVLTPSLNSYFLIQYHLKEQLQTGDYLVKKLQGVMKWTHSPTKRLRNEPRLS